MPWRTEGSTTARGYGPEHRTLRAQWAPVVKRGEAQCMQGMHGSSGTCLHTSRHIQPDEPWALGHNDARTGWIGPVHKDCNEADARRRGGLAAHRRMVTMIDWHSRDW